MRPYTRVRMPKVSNWRNLYIGERPQVPAIKRVALRYNLPLNVAHGM